MGLYGLGVICLIVLVRVTAIQRIFAVFAMFLTFSLLWVSLPNYLRERYFTLSTPDADREESLIDVRLRASAAGSTVQRTHLLNESIFVTLTHPVFGVGLGNFSPYLFQFNQTVGLEKEPYLGTHNTYTQISSEAGMPALLVFLGIIVISWRSLTRLIHATRDDIRPEVKDIHYTALATQCTVAAFFFCLCFIHVAYDPLPHIVIGLAFIVSSTGHRELLLLNAGGRVSPSTPAPPNRVLSRMTLRTITS
jgi:O-antigen ligase